jgi:hypothetical protein
MLALLRDQFIDPNPYAEGEEARGELCGIAQLLPVCLRNGTFRPKVDTKGFIVQSRVSLFVAIKSNTKDQPYLRKD